MTSRPRLAAPGPVRELYVELDAAAEAGAAAAPATDLTNNDDDPLSDLPEQLPRSVDCRGRLPREADRHHLRPERRIKRPVPNGALARLLVPATSRMLQEVDALDEVLLRRMLVGYYLGVATRADHRYPAERLLCGGDS